MVGSSRPGDIRLHLYVSRFFCVAVQYLCFTLKDKTGQDMRSGKEKVENEIQVWEDAENQNQHTA